MPLSLLLRRAVALGLAVGVIGAGGAQASIYSKKPPRIVVGPNLVVNPSFEDATVYVPPVPSVAGGTPLGPVGWTFEGATILFDYNERLGHTGTRNVAISGSLAPGTQVCDASSGAYMCVPNPAAATTTQVTNASLARYSIRPFWVSAAPIPVHAGKIYRFSMWSIRPSLDPNAGVLGEGAASKVRWVDASGATLTVVDGPSSVKTAKRELGFHQSTLDLVAPVGAAGAKLMLGHTDYTVTSAQVAFDDVGFAELSRK